MIKAILFLKSTLLISLFSFSQNSFKAIYEGYVKTGSANIGSRNYHCNILTDTSFLSFPINNTREVEGQLIFGNKIKHHSMYYFSNTKTYYFGNNWRKNKYFMKGVPRLDHQAWFLDTTITHYYQGYKCANAFKIKPSGDTIFVVYTPDIKYPAGLNYYNGLPGLVLETFDSERNYYEKLILLQQNNFEIRLPSDELLKHSSK
ncbi:MAG TPA: hypothetical protein PKU77_05850 [Ferruginibacter sp.]|nr:hypothetical protein [Ferruginibacter sp.]